MKTSIPAVATVNLQQVKESNVKIKDRKKQKYYTVSKI